MNKLVVDSSTRAKLRNLEEPLELFDESGRVLGVFSPVRRDEALYRDVEVPFTPEEVQRLLKQAPGRPLAEILGELEKRP